MSVAAGGSRRRRRAWKAGLMAETKCVWYLRLRGYRVLARRLRTPVGEVDIIARRGRVLAIIEVKARRRLDVAAESLSPRQRRRIARAADWFLAGHPECRKLQVRFDAMLLSPWRLPRHLAGAWRPDE